MARQLGEKDKWLLDNSGEQYKCRDNAEELLKR
jgi:hypothetical protein